VARLSAELQGAAGISIFEPPDFFDAPEWLLSASQMREAVSARIKPDIVFAILAGYSSECSKYVTPAFDNLPAGSYATLCTHIPTGKMPEALRGALLQALKRSDRLFVSTGELVGQLASSVHIPLERLFNLPAGGQDIKADANFILDTLENSPIADACRPSLAYHSPLPPARSGIADYSLELLPDLARHYSITLITDQTDLAPPWLRSLFPVRGVNWFERHGDSFDRILYHIGNSRFHSQMFGLLARHPGTIVLHDVFLADIIEGLGYETGDPQALLRTAYRDHGFMALQQEKSQGRQHLLESCPCSLHIMQKASGVLLHSQFARNILTSAYGAGISPHIRQVPFMRLPPQLPERNSARARLGFAPDDHIVCSFGFLGPTKLNHRLLDAWLQSGLSRNPRCKLLFVGSNHQGEYGRELLNKIRKAGGSGSITITGFIEPTAYRDFLAAADLAVQLRENSRGETSAAVYDCLAAELPIICNAHGSSAELPDETVMQLPDRFSDTCLQQALELFLNSPDEGRRRAVNGIAYLRNSHHPAAVAAAYQQAIEYFSATSPRSMERRLLAGLPELNGAERGFVAAALASNRPYAGLRQLLVDISAVARHDLKTGIERVVRSILNQLLTAPPPGYRIEPVYYNDNGGYSYARKFALKTLGLDETVLEDTPVQAFSGDLFLGADLILAAIPSVERCLWQWKIRGVQTSFILYDLLPIQRPDCFPPHVETSYREWLRIVCAVSDNLVCISRAVADELAGYLAVNPLDCSRTLKIGHFHLGADIGASLPTTGLPADMEHQLQKIAANPAFLMVGTIEPRKGHTQALDAFELLWRQGIDVSLVIIGKAGWMTEKLIERLDRHPENGRHLFCLRGLSDEALEKIYPVCIALLAPSEGEGFGLPLIEGAQHSLPLIVRDIAVFREVAGENAAYFSGKAPEDLARAIDKWLKLPAHERVSAAGMTWLTWRQSTDQLLAELRVKE